MSARTRNLMQWAQEYGIDRRQARRLRRRFARTGERPCTERGCLLRGERPHVVHYGTLPSGERGTWAR